MIKCDSTILPPKELPITCGTTVGYSVMTTVDTMKTEIPLTIVGDTIIMEMPADTTNKLLRKTPVDSNVILKTDALKTKNPPLADSNNCETKIFY
jgi:hypothetical protein